VTDDRVIQFKPVARYTSEPSPWEDESEVAKKRREVLAKKGVLLQDYYTRKELAKALGFSIVTIARMDKAGTGPKSMILGGVRLYPKQGVQEWIEAALKTETTSSKPKPKK
jgi:predicted DNA-binding transcriptional regulator AlpA